jgi:hypothetical protein
MVMYIIPYILPHMSLGGMYLKENKKRISREQLKHPKQFGQVVNVTSIRMLTFVITQKGFESRVVW